MLNENFRKIGSNVKAMNKKGEGIFGLLMAYSVPNAANGHESLRAEFKTQEKHVTEELKVKLGENSTYKVAKNLILNCVEAGISLTTPDGKHKGKTQLEEELADTKVAKTPMDKFRAAIAAAEKAADKLNDGECITAAALADTLFKSVAVRIKAAA